MPLRPDHRQASRLQPDPVSAKSPDRWRPGLVGLGVPIQPADGLEEHQCPFQLHRFAETLCRPDAGEVLVLLPYRGR